jgi:hypothetical protein
MQKIISTLFLLSSFNLLHGMNPNAITAQTNSPRRRNEPFILSCSSDAQVHLQAEYLENLKRISGTINSFTGGTCHRDLKVDISPEQFAYIVDLYTGIENLSETEQHEALAARLPTEDENQVKMLFEASTKLAMPALAHVSLEMLKKRRPREYAHYSIEQNREAQLMHAHGFSQAAVNHALANDITAISSSRYSNSVPDQNLTSSAKPKHSNPRTSKSNGTQANVQEHELEMETHNSGEKEFVNPYDFVFEQAGLMLNNQHLRELECLYTNDDQSRDLANNINRQLRLSDHELFGRVKNLFKSISGNNTIPTTSIDAIQKLALFYGKPDKKDPNSVRNCVLNRFPTETMAGKVLLAKRLAEPSNIAKIRSFQNLVRPMNVPAVRWAIRGHINEISKSERALLALWTVSESNFEDMIKRYVDRRIPDLVFTEPSAQSIGLANAPSDEFGQQKLGKKISGYFYRIATDGKPESDPFIKTLRAFLTKRNREILRFHQSVEQISHTFITPVIQSVDAQNYNALKGELDNYLNSPHTQKFIHLQSRLAAVQNDPITQLGIYFKISRRLYLMKNDLLKAYKAVGKLDAILSIAQVMNNSQYPFCFAEFDESDEVKLELEDYWSLLLKGNNIKTNSLSIGPKDPHIMIIRGVNKYGKTTAIKAIGICEYLASTIGVVPARTCRLSKPAHVLTSIEETDAPGGFSKGEAQVEALINLIENASASTQPHVLIIDELLESVDAPTLADVLPLAFGHTFPALSSKIIGLIVAQKVGEQLQGIIQKDPINYRLLYGHEDFTINEDRTNALDYSSLQNNVLARLRRAVGQSE